jgi:hypothetical protein
MASDQNKLEKESFLIYNIDIENEWKEFRDEENMYEKNKGKLHFGTIPISEKEVDDMWNKFIINKVSSREVSYGCEGHCPDCKTVMEYYAMVKKHEKETQKLGLPGLD